MFSLHVEIIIFYLFLLKYCSTFILHEETNYSNHKEIVDATTHFANKNFNFRLETVVISEDIDDGIVDTFLKYFNGTVVIEVKRDGLPPEQVVVFIKSLKSFRNVLDMLKPDLKGKSLLHSGTKFIIAIYSQSYRIGRIFNILWSYYVTNVLVIMNDKRNMTVLYTYFPYANHTYCQNTKPFFLGFANKTNTNLDGYPNKMKNMQECPLYISTNKPFHPGIDNDGHQKIPLYIIQKNVVYLLQEVMKFTPIISTKDSISIDSDRIHSWSDSLNDVINGVANISTTTISVGVERLGLLDFSFPYFRIPIVWIAPPVKPGYVWLRLLSPLNGYMWLLLLIILSFLKSLPVILKMKPVKEFTRQHFHGIQKLKGVGFRIWGVMVGQPIRVAPKRFRDFYIIGMWLWFTFVVRSAYQSVLIGSLKTEATEGNFNSLKEAVENGYRFGGKAAILSYFEYDPQICKEFEIVPELRFEDMFDDVLEGKRRFILAMSLEYAIAYCLSRGINENECGHVLPDSIMTLPLVVWMRKHSPFTQTVSIWMKRFLESGLLDRGVMKPATIGRAQSSTDPTPLTLNQIFSCFLCLVIGYVISGILFCFEIYKF